MKIVDDNTLKISASEFFIALEKQNEEYDHREIKSSQNFILQPEWTLTKSSIVNKLSGYINPNILSFRIPTAPNEPIVPNNPNITKLIVVDQIDLRGKSISTPMTIYGIYFQGQVDLSDVNIKGSLDLTGCVFSNELKLNDASITGSLKLDRISAKSIDLVNINIHSQLSLYGSGIQKCIKLQGAKVGGRIDFLAVSAESILMKGMNIQGNVRIGCGKEGAKELGYIGLIDGSYSTIGEDLTIIGVGWNKNISTSVTDKDKYRKAEPFIGNHTEWENESLPGPKLFFNGCAIKGSFQIGPYKGYPYDLSTSAIKGTDIVWPVIDSLYMNNALIEGNFDISGAFFCNSGLSANNAHIKGSITFSTACITLYKKTDDHFLYTLISRELRINGDQNSISLKNSRVDGDITIYGIITKSTFFAYGISCGGAFFISCFQINSQTENKVFFRTQFRGGLNLGRAQIKGAIVIQGVFIQNDLDLWGLQSDAFLRIGEQKENRTEINGKLNLSIAETKDIQFCAIRVRGYVKISNVQTGNISFSPARLGSDLNTEPSNDAFVLCELGALNIQNATISGNLNLSHIQVRGSKIILGRQGLYIENTTIEGMLEFFKIGIFRDLYQSRRDNNNLTEEMFLHLKLPIESSTYSAGIFGNLGIKKCTIKGDCDLSFIKVSKKIDLEDTYFGGDLKFSSILTFFGPDANPELIKKLRSIDKPLYYQYRAICSKLNMRMVKCTNDIDLTGLSVFTNNKQQINFVSVNARYIEVAGDLIAYANCENKESYIISPGEMDLSHSKISRLIISAHSFPYISNNQISNIQTKEKEFLNNGLVLERSEIGLLDLRDIGDEHNFKYPKPIKLTDSKVDTWKIAEKSEENANSNRFIKLLKNAQPFRRATYQAIEKNLRNSGHENEANKLYIEMMNMAWVTKPKNILIPMSISPNNKKPEKGLFPQLAKLRYIVCCLVTCLFVITSRFASYILHLLFKHLLKYGTSPTPLFMIALLLLLISLPAYGPRDNFEPSIEYLSIHPERFSNFETATKANQSPPTKLWGNSEALGMIIKNHLPVVTFSARDEWEASDKAPTTWSYVWNGSCIPNKQNQSEYKPSNDSTLCLPFSPEDAFNTIQVLNWIIWPLLLTHFVRRLLRQT